MEQESGVESETNNIKRDRKKITAQHELSSAELENILFKKFLHLP